jgi:ubiquinone/menaquinone biosynthesis C-methylase UbiE
VSNRPKDVSPALFFETINGYKHTAAIKAAIELDIFTAINEGNRTVKDIASRINASERGTRILADYLVIIGFLIKEDNHYSLTTDSEVYLNRNSPAYMGSVIDFALSSLSTEAFSNLTDAVRKGGTALKEEEGTIAPDHPLWVKFAKGMAPAMFVPAQLIAKLVDAERNRPLKILDIAAGHGLFGIAFAKHNPQAEVVAVDWSQVLEVARENARKSEVEDRYTTLNGNAFEVSFGGNYDIILLTNFLHHLDVPACEALLKKIYAALVDGGRVVTLEFIPNEDRISPPDAARFALTMLATTPNGDAYTFAEYEKMFTNAGFKRNELYPLPPTPEQVIVSYK